jgi:hypothetical protein
MGFIIIIAIIVLVIWLASDKDDGAGNVAGAVASIAIGMAAGKALNRKLNGDVDNLGKGDDYKPGGKYYNG